MTDPDYFHLGADAEAIAVWLESIEHDDSLIYVLDLPVLDGTEDE